MTTEKKHLLDKTFQSFMELGLSGENMDILDEMVAKDVVGFGTTIDEKIFGVKELRDLLIRQKEQSAGMEMKWKINTLDIHISSDENTVIYTNDMTLYITVDGNPIEMYMRFSVVLEYVQHKWLVVHWHGSKPEHVASEKDTWGVQTWKEKAEELEKEVAERTADLVEKNKELEIETALERVRSTSLAMHSSNDLGKVVYVVFTELIKLDAQLDRCLILIVDPQKLGITWYLTGKEGLLSNNGFLVPDNTHPSHQAYLEGWRTKRKKWHYLLAGEEKQRWDAFGFSETQLAQLPDFIKADMAAVKAIHLTISSDDFGCLIASSLSPLSETHASIVERFTNVFNQTYMRFLDLQKAEAQAREAQIEAALERVRSRSMAMYKSEELPEVIQLVFEQLKQLNFNIDSAQFDVNFRESDDLNMWTAIPGQPYPTRQHIPYFNNAVVNSVKNAKEAGLTLSAHNFTFEEKNEFFNHFFKHTSVPEERREFILSLPGWARSVVYLDRIYLGIQNYSGILYSEAEHTILGRFAKVFEQAYTRFLDLQTAEANAREAQIEAALERVRAKSMAMHKSEQLPETAQVLFEQFAVLGKTPDRMSIGVYNEELGVSEWWVTYQEGIQIKHQFTAPLQEPTHAKMFSAWKEGKESIVIELEGDDLKEWVTFVRQVVKMPMDESQIKGRRVHQAAFFSQGQLLISSHEALPVETVKLLVRFAKVFSQTYTRFLDLQKAESQTREAQIEAALERIRSRALAMHRSEEFSDVAKVMREQMGYLGQPELETSAVHLYDEDADNIFSWRAFRLSSYLEGNIISGFFKIPRNSCAIAIEFIQKFNSNATEYTIEVSGEKQTKWYEILFKLAPEVEAAMKISGTTNEIRYYHFSKFSGGALLMVSSKEPANDAIELQKRSAQVFDLAYRRFKDLQKAEAQALEAIKRASVDRVRAEIASMRTTSDLERIQPLIWNELKTLGVPFIRCGVFIMNDEKQDVQAFLSTPDGKSIAAFHMSYNATEQSKQIVVHWQQKQIFKDHMDEKAFVDYTKKLVQQGAVASDEKYVTENRPTDLYLHFLPFLQGMLYVGNDAPLNDEELQLVQNLADAFSTAYARYEDFNKLDVAKTAIEAAMRELKATQSQLVQQEKLASLGQLTAGIAHEIKNPLNFVNNFSEVSIELIDEVLQEIEKNQDKRDETLISDILKDIRSNVQKVHDHGFRANTIVTSMLQHSRGGTGNMNPTDLNALIREYVNLSYHGMRASKTPIDVDLVLDLDPALGLVSIIKEDFTRVVINLSNNAFDAMREKMKTRYEERGTKDEVGEEGQNTKYDVQGMKYEVGEGHRVDYKPTLSIQTRLENGKVLIQFEDNGPGIPDENRDKILQPFFTTKKGTEGTGLGLSITNDIVKAHGGELKVETKEGEGTIFTIQLNAKG